MKITIDNLELARFTAEDTQALYNIRNHDSVRLCMSHSAIIPYEAHERWARANLLEGRGLLLFMVRLRHEEPIGFTMLKRQSDDAAEIGIIFQEAARHPVVPLIATVATVHLAFCHLNLAWLLSYLLPTNERALALNQCFGMTEIESDKPGEMKMHVSREVVLANANYVKVYERMKTKLVISGKPSDIW